MCFYNSMSAKAVALAARYGRKSDIIEIVRDIIEERKVIPAYDTTPSAIITADEEIQPMYWGLIPYWVKPKSDDPEDIAAAQKLAYRLSKGTYNARSETVFEKPSFRYPIRKKRCLIPSTGYYEPHYEPGVKGAQYYYIYLPEQEIYSMAGIYDEWKDPETGEYIKTFSQLTVPANDLARRIHNGGKNPFRMPVILRQNDEERWLDPDLPEDDIKLLMAPYPSDKMEAYPVETLL